MDACLWLLRHGIPPERLTWIKPRDSWLLDRAAVQPGPQFARRVLADFSAQSRAIKAADSIDDLFARLDERGCLLRIDDAVEPSMYRCAIVSQAELEQLRRIDDVVRMGHVVALEPGRIALDDGTIDADPSALYVDCTGDGIGHAGGHPRLRARPHHPAVGAHLPARRSAPRSPPASRRWTSTTTPRTTTAGRCRIRRSRSTGSP